MRGSRTSIGLTAALVAALAFGTSGAFIKPVLDAGWSPGAAVAIRALIGGLVILPIAIVALRGAWTSVWRGRWRIILMAVIGVAGTQLVYFEALARIPVGTAILIEYTAPLLLVAVVWARTARMPQPVVLIGSVLAMAGLVFVIAPGSDGLGSLDPVGVAFAVLASIGCAGYYLIAAQPSDGLPPVAFAAFGLLLGGILLFTVGLTGLMPFAAPLVDVPVLGATAPWWLPLLIVGVIGTGLAYSASITGSELLGSRLASFVGLLEVVAAALYAWLLLGETLTAQQLLGGVLILAGIAFVRSERATEASTGLATIEPSTVIVVTPADPLPTAPIPVRP